MNLFRRITIQPRQKTLTELAETVANDCHWEVWNRIVGRTGTMLSIIEAQSYIRTRATQIAHHRAAQIITSEHAMSARWAQPVADAALDVIAARLAGPLLKRDLARAA